MVGLAAVDEWHLELVGSAVGAVERRSVDVLGAEDTMRKVHDLEGLDLNLLVVLEALLAEESVTGAATRLGRTQPAVSQALARLRRTFDDPILVRSGARMEPTPLGRRLAEPVADALSVLREGLRTVTPFDARSDTRDVAVAAPDFAVHWVPELVSAMDAELPAARLVVEPPPDDLASALTQGRVDAAIIPRRTAPGLDIDVFAELPWVITTREQHPIRRWTPTRWEQARHVIVRTPGSGPGPVDHAATERGLSRMVALVVSHFAAIPAVLAASDLIHAGPRGVVEARDGLRQARAPLDIPGLPLGVAVSVHRRHDPRTETIREAVAAACRRALSASADAAHPPRSR